MSTRNLQINVRFTPEELEEIDAILARPEHTGLETRSRAAVVRAALRIYLESSRITGEAPRIADAVAAICASHRQAVSYVTPLPQKARRTA